MAKQITFTETQMTYLKALKTLGFRYIAKDFDNDIYAYLARPEKGAETDFQCWWDVRGTGHINLTYSDEILKALSPLCEWKDGGAFNIVNALAAGKVTSSEQKIEKKTMSALTEAQMTYLEALKVLGFRYIARDVDDETFAYLTRPQKNLDYWLPVDFHVNLFNTETNCWVGLSNLCNWKDEKPLNIIGSLAAGKAVFW